MAVSAVRSRSDWRARGHRLPFGGAIARRTRKPSPPCGQWVHGRWPCQSTWPIEASCNRLWPPSRATSGQCPYSSTTRRSRPSAGSWTFRRRTGIASSKTDLTACFLLAKYAAQSMVRRQAGKIINLASTYSLFGSAFAPSYSAAKGAIMQLTKSLAIELAPHNIQVNAILPGWIDTDLTEPIKGMPLYQEILTRTPAGRFGTPAECAGAAVFLASAAARFVTGTALVVDGGYAIR